MNRGFGERVKRLREQANLSRKFVATQIGISLTRVTQIESGQADENDLTSTEFKALVRMFHVTPDYLENGPLLIAETPRNYTVMARRDAPHGTVQLKNIQPELSFSGVQRSSFLSYGMDRCLTCQHPASGVRCDRCGRAIE